MRVLILKLMSTIVAVLAGGHSGEYAVSMKSAQTIYEHLDTNHFEPYLVTVKREGWFVEYNGVDLAVDLNAFAFTTDEGLKQFDYAYIIIHGTPGENGLIQGYLEMKNIPYSTGSALNMAFTFNKGATQTLFASKGMRVAEHFIFNTETRPEADAIAAKLGLPCFVKPTESGSSIGVSRAEDIAALDKAIDEAFEVHPEVIVESEISGRELACGVLRTKDGVQALPVTEIIPKGEFFDYKAKYEDASTQEITPANISEDATARCQQLAKEVYLASNSDGIARVDFFLADEDIYLVEINTVPGMSKESIVPKQLKVAGLNLQHYLSWKIQTDLNTQRHI